MEKRLSSVTDGWRGYTSSRMDNWHDCMKMVCQIYRDEVAYFDIRTNRGYTYGEYRERTNRFVNALTDMGVKKGDRVAIFSNNRPEYIEAASICECGIIYVPVNFRLAGDEMAYIINDSGANTLIAEAGLMDVVEAVRPSIPGVERLLCFDAATDDAPAYEDLIARYPATDPQVRPIGDDLLGIVYTTGTTAKPKGVMRKHGEVVRAVKMFPLLLYPGWSHGNTILTAAPMFHVAILHFYFAGFMIGVSFHLLHRVDPELMLKTIEKEKIPILQATPTVVNMLLEHPDCAKYDLSSLRLVQYSGMSMPPGTLEKGIKRLGPVFQQHFGLTEASGALIGLYKEDHIEALQSSDEKVRGRLRSAGRPVAELRIVDDNDNDVPIGEVGQILGRCDAMFAGYWNNSNATAEALRGGWFHTGDMGRMDEDGFVYIVDRKKDMIISGGENVSSIEVEGVISLHPAVKEVAVIGVLDEKWGEAVKAVVVLKDGATATQEEIIEFCRPRMAGFKRPKSVDFWLELPRTPQGKVLKRQMRERYAQGL